MMRLGLRAFGWILFLVPITVFAQTKTELPKPLKVGFSIGIAGINLQKMQYAKASGISSVQISLNPLVDKKGDLKLSNDEISDLVYKVKKDLDSSGIIAYAFHMPFGQYMDISVIDDKAREKVQSIHKKLLRLCAPLKPKVVLFHPSWYLSLNQRQEHIDQMVKSAKELVKPVENIGAIMVLENMTGPKLYVVRKGVKYERPLLRTVEEMTAIMDKLPSDIYVAVDMNHILHPEKMVLALGQRLKFIHVSDGDGAHERHYFPCSVKGMNDWMAIIDALYKVGYSGPFMYECHYKGLRDFMPCYNFMYNKYVLEKYISPEYKK